MVVVIIASATRRTFLPLLALLLIITLYKPNMDEREEGRTIDTHQETFYPIPPSIQHPHVKDYREFVDEIDHDWKKYWLDNARQLLSWDIKPDKSFEGDFNSGKVEWFSDGKLNIAYNCVDRHPAENIALIWEGDEPGNNKSITFGELKRQTNQLANYLYNKGIRKGDAVAIYMPMVPETIVAMLACARIGAMHNVVFAGFSAESLADRIFDSKAKIVFTADQGLRGGKIVPLKETCDSALERVTDEGHKVETVVIYKRTGASISLIPGRDEYWQDVVPQQSEHFDSISVESENPLFMLYTSGSTGKPKGLVHSSAGYLLYAMMTFKYTFDYHDGDIFGCLADVGWITGHSYIVYGPLSNGATTVLFESTPTYPNPSRYWDVIERLKITQLYTAPTVIRALKKFGDEPLRGYDLSSLRIIGTVGEPINPDAWIWYYERVGGGKCAVVDTYWQTETGGHVITPLPGAIKTKAGSAAMPFPGIKVGVLDQHTGQTLAGNNVEGVLVIGRPWPGMSRTIFGNHSKFYETYFRPYPGHYFSGDRVYRDTDGYYWIRGRVDDVINVSGHRLSTAEIESALGKHPMCAEAAVLGRPDEITGQSIWAFCIVKPEASKLNPIELEVQLKQVVRKAIGSFSTPKRVILCDDLPKTRSGKIMRRIIRKILEGVTDVSQIGDTTTLNNPSIVQDLIESVRAADSNKI